MPGNYLPHQQAERLWTGQLDQSQGPAYREQPRRRSGSGQNFDRPWGGARETEFKTSGQAISQGINSLGNILLYKEFVDKQKANTDEVVEHIDRLGHPDQHTGAPKKKQLGLPSGARAQGPPKPKELGPGSSGSLDAGPRVHSMGGPPTPMGPIKPDEVIPPTRGGGSFNPRRPGANMRVIDIPDTMGTPGQMELPLDFGQRGPKAPGLDQPSARQPGRRSRAGMDARRRNGGWI